MISFFEDIFQYESFPTEFECFKQLKDVENYVAVPWTQILNSHWFNFPGNKGRDYFLKVKHELKNIQKEAAWGGILREDSQWAFAEQGSFKMALRKMYKNHNKFKIQAEDLQKIVNNDFSDEVLFERFCKVFYNEEEQAELEKEIDSLLEDLL